MKIKIYLLICIFIIPFFDPVIGYENNIEEKNQINLIENEIKNFNSIPIWEIGDSWKYRINEIVLINEDLKNPINVEFGECILTLNVVGVSDEYYHLDFQTNLYGNFELIVSNYNIKLLGKFNILRPLKAHGTVFIDNTDLSIRGLTLYLSGLFKINFADRLLFTLPFPIDLCIELRAEPGLKILKFPLIVENIYGLPSFNITIDGEISSPWFRIIKIINTVTKLFGNPFLSNKFSEFLPRIDFGEILNWYSGNNTYYVNNLTWYDVPVFAVESFENITTEVGTYQSFKILFPFDMGSIYYAPEVGNMIKLTLNPITTMELLETTFQQ